MEIDTSDGSIKSTYVYANSQILLQHPGPAYNPGSSRYFYLHDRLGSVRMVIEQPYGQPLAVVNNYTYEPFGEMIATECTENTENSFKFTGQYYDAEIAQYYLRARMYDPQVMCFGGVDSISSAAV